MDIVCDLGGTNARFGLAVEGRLQPETLSTFANDDFPDFPSVLSAYRDTHARVAISAVCVAMAAVPTAEGAQLTNRDWEISRTDIRRVCGTDKVHFINDFEALGLSLLRTDDLETRMILEGRPPVGPATRVVMGAGTGFNAAACFPPRIGPTPYVSAAECGHMTLAIEGADELDLQRFLARGRGRASNERALSGRGLLEIYQWCCERAARPAVLVSSGEVVERAIAGGDSEAGEAGKYFLRFFGRVAGDLALAFLPFGGIFLSGGVTRAVAPLIETSTTFLDAFQAKGRQTELMATFPIGLLLDDLAALSGCAEWVRLQTRAD
jgi:glucokinase